MSASIKTLLVFLCLVPLIWWLGTQVGDEEYTVPIIMGLLVVGFALNHLFLPGIRYDAFLVGFLAFGYIVGNRGFAQLGPTQSVPLYVGEICMVVCLLYAVIQQIIQRGEFLAPFYLSKVLVGYLGFSGIRLAFDFQTYGIDAIRDSAMVYYAVFFFVAYQFGLHEPSRRFFEKSMMAGLIFLIPTGLISRFAPEIYDHIAFRGVPLILQKGDLVGIFFCMGAIVFACASYHSRWRKSMVTLSVVSVMMMLYTGARAGLAGMVLPLIILGVARLQSLLRYVVIIVAVGVFGTIVYAGVTNSPLANLETYNLYEKFLATADVNHTFHYNTDGSGDVSADNNQFRLVWWNLIISDTLATSPWIGMGFGYDLAEHFQKVYFGELRQDFDVRSPHCYLMTVFARLGVVGLIFVFAIMYYLVRWSYQSALDIRHGHEDFGRLTACLSALVIFVGACFGVVLEGPMGGILFWSLLGISCAYESEAAAKAKDPYLRALALLRRVETMYPEASRGELAPAGGGRLPEGARL